MKDHRLIDERSLAFERLVARKLRENPALLNKARNNLQRWLSTCSPSVRPALIEWQNLVDSPFDVLLSTLEAEDERSTRLRQSSPFCGIISQEERTAIIKEFQARDSVS